MQTGTPPSRFWGGPTDHLAFKQIDSIPLPFINRLVSFVILTIDTVYHTEAFNKIYVSPRIHIPFSMGQWDTRIWIWCDRMVLIMIEAPYYVERS